MNRKKIIDYLIMRIIDEVYKARDMISNSNLTEYEDIEYVDVRLQNINYIAKMIIEEDGAK